MDSLLHRAPGAARADELGKRSSFRSSMRFAHLALAQLKKPVPSANLRCEGATFHSWVGVLGTKMGKFPRGLLHYQLTAVYGEKNG
jgi:hypothetical protein